MYLSHKFNGCISQDNLILTLHYQIFFKSLYNALNSVRHINLKDVFFGINHEPRILLSEAYGIWLHLFDNLFRSARVVVNKHAANLKLRYMDILMSKLIETFVPTEGVVRDRVYLVVHLRVCLRSGCPAQ